MVCEAACGSPVLFSVSSRLVLGGNEVRWKANPTRSTCERSRHNTVESVLPRNLDVYYCTIPYVLDGL